METSPSPHCRGSSKGSHCALAGQGAGRNVQRDKAEPGPLYPGSTMGKVTFPGLSLTEQKVGFSPV